MTSTTHGRFFGIFFDLKALVILVHKNDEERHYQLSSIWNEHFFLLEFRIILINSFSRIHSLEFTDEKKYVDADIALAS